MAVNGRVALIAGAGGVLGTALYREFEQAGYTTVGLRRTSRGTLHKACDLQDADAVARTLEEVLGEFGRVDCLICNTARLVVAPFLELTYADFLDTWAATMASAVACCRAVLPGMLQRGHGSIIFSGATGSMRGSARFAAFSAAKFALRGFAQALAREYQPRGIHVAHVVLDGLLRGSASVARFGGRDETAMPPDEIARTYRWLAEQVAPVWTHELDLRPQGEKF